MQKSQWQWKPSSEPDPAECTSVHHPGRSSVLGHPSHRVLEFTLISQMIPEVHQPRAPASQRVGAWPPSPPHWWKSSHLSTACFPHHLSCREQSAQLLLPSVLPTGAAPHLTTYVGPSGSLHDVFILHSLLSSSLQWSPLWPNNKLILSPLRKSRARPCLQIW